MNPIRSIVALELVFLAGTILHIDYFNGLPYWQWPWRHLGYLRTTFYFMLPLFPYGYALYKTETFKDRNKAYKILGVLAVSNFLFQVIGMATESQFFETVKSIIASRRATSYFYDASQMTDAVAFLRDFHALDLRAHSSTHPPGPILYYYGLIRLFGADAAPYVGAFVIAFTASMGVFVLYLFSSLWTTEAKPRLTICTYYALIPGLVLFFPQLDQVYPIFSMLLIYLWDMSLRRSRHYAIYFGAVLFAATFFAYNLLVVGAFHLLSTSVFLLSDRRIGKRFRIVASAGLLAVGTAGACYVALFEMAGFRPLLTVARTLKAHIYLVNALPRPYVVYLFYNFYEFFLGSGIVVMPLLVAYIRRASGRQMADDTVFSYLGFLTIAMVDLTGLFRSEITRLWLFLQPLVVVPAGLELVRLSAAQRLAVYLMLWVNLIVIKANMWFIVP